MTRSWTDIGVIRHAAMVMALAASLFALPSTARADAGEDGAAALFDRVSGQPARLRVFLQTMPKGGDLHNHLWGQPYAEEFLAWAADAGQCVLDGGSRDHGPAMRQAETVPARDLGARNPALYNAMIEAFSTRGRAYGLAANEISGHDDFFSSFGRFAASAAVSSGRMVASARESAAANAVSYLELIQNPNAIDTFAGIANGLPWDPDKFSEDLARLADHMPPLLRSATAEIDQMEAEAERRLGCKQQARNPACQVEVRYQLFALRSQPPAYVFGELALAFALADKDQRIAASISSHPRTALSPWRIMICTCGCSASSMHAIRR